ncbi:T9SS type A sorting domain-containing protein [Thermophagus sp. OGC60D27]|uniref:T9SS type A sorting domain-containing protein n=1 Tax=Thermophagus sp. OGC60D27 TaxID=3458415 RepID=UPI004037DB1B
MKKSVLFISFLLFLSVAMMGQYSYYPYQEKFSAGAYSVPDANFNDLEALDLSETDVGDTQSFGMRWDYFDQVDATGNSVFKNDKEMTFGWDPDVVGEPQTAGGQIRGWTLNDEVAYPDYNQQWAVVRFNGNPASPRFSGGWYYYTINFSQADDYALIFRVRGAPASSDSHLFSFEVFNKNDMNTAVHSWNVNLEGMDFSSIGSTSSDGKYTNIGQARAGKTGQAGTYWVIANNAADLFNVSATGEYVVKVSQAYEVAGNTNSAYGGFSFYNGDMGTIPTGIFDSTVKDYRISAQVTGNRLSVTGNIGQTSISVYNLAGTMVMKKTVEGAVNNEILSLRKGLYIIKIIDSNSNKQSVKVMIN